MSLSLRNKTTQWQCVNFTVRIVTMSKDLFSIVVKPPVKVSLSFKFFTILVKLDEFTKISFTQN